MVAVLPKVMITLLMRSSHVTYYCKVNLTSMAIAFAIIGTSEGRTRCSSQVLSCEALFADEITM